MPRRARAINKQYSAKNIYSNQASPYGCTPAEKTVRNYEASIKAGSVYFISARFRVLHDPNGYS